ncbi:MAG TPA: hypothetical protein VK622_13640 [Puia sp.]|nr:hypothetical protein [Puia sp.]
MRNCRFWIVGLLGVVCSGPAHSQYNADTLFNESVASFRNIYFQEIQGNARLYQGSKYDVQEKRADGFPYFQADVIRQGTITFQGTRYAPVNLYYDLTSDAVVTVNYLHDDLISLDPDKIDSFTIGRHLFIHLDKLNGLPGKGFYDQLYAGDPGLYVRRAKKFRFGTGNQESRYVEKNDYYIQAHNIFYKCENKSDMLTILGDQAEALKKYIHNNKIDFKEDFESALLSCVTYYAGLKR